MGWDDPQVVQDNARWHKVHAAIAEDARRTERLLWKASGKPQPKAGVQVKRVFTAPPPASRIDAFKSKGRVAR